MKKVIDYTARNLRIKIKEGQVRCTMCEKPMDEDKVKSAEFSATDGEYYRHGVPSGHESTGWYDLGPECWKKANK